MDVIVIGMYMPTACEDCGFFRLYRSNGRVWCNARNRILCQKWENPDFTELHIDKPDWCPLHPLPEKHGRLVDVDDMERFMSDTVQGDIRAYPYSDTLWDMAFRWIDSRPTIVEAEGE